MFDEPFHWHSDFFSFCEASFDAYKSKYNVLDNMTNLVMLKQSQPIFVLKR